MGEVEEAFRELILSKGAYHGLLVFGPSMPGEGLSR